MVIVMSVAHLPEKREQQKPILYLIVNGIQWKSKQHVAQKTTYCFALHNLLLEVRRKLLQPGMAFWIYFDIFYPMIQKNVSCTPQIQNSHVRRLVHVGTNSRYLDIFTSE